MISKETFIKNINLIKQNRCQVLNICEAIEKAFSSDSYLNPEFFYKLEAQFIDLLAASLEINADCYLMELFYMWIYDNEFGTDSVGMRIFIEQVPEDALKDLDLSKPEDFYEMIKNLIGGELNGN